MTAVLIPTSSEAEWLELRRLGITASEIAVIMGLSPYSSPYALYHQKLGTIGGPDDTEAMALGRFLEGYVCDRFAELRPEFKVEGDGRTLWQHSRRPWQMATPDRLVYGCSFGTEDCPGYEALAVLEAKTAASYDGWGDDGSDEIPVHYRCQVLWQMDVVNVTTAFVACLFLHARRLRVYEITMDDAARADLELMKAEALAFMERLEAGDPPGVDYRPATIDALKALHPSVTDEERVLSPQLARRYYAAVRNHKHWEQRKKLYEAQIRERLGSARRASTADGVFARRDVFEQREHVRKATTVDKLVPVYPKEQKS